MSDTNTEEEDPLITWNNINKENALQEMISATYISVTETTKNIDRFSAWVLAGTGATGALLITQVDTILPYLTSSGFKWSMVFLVASGACGFIAKIYSILCEIQVHTSSRVTELTNPIFKKYNVDKKEIEDLAAKRKIEVRTEFTVDEFLSEYLRPFKGVTKWLINKGLAGKKIDRQTRYHNAIKLYMKQTKWTTLQAASFVIFLCVGTYFVTSA